MIDLRCYVITTGTGAVEAATAAASAGAGIVQVRAKELTSRELLAFTLAVAEAVHQARPATRVVVDDRVDIALAAMRRGAEVHGVHLGADDLPVRDARAVLGSEAIIGFTTGSLALVRAAEADAEVIDYLGAGPFRPTPTKDSGRAPIGLDGYPPLVAATRLPIVAIGDVQAGDVAGIAATGVAGVAMVRAVMSATDPGAVVRGVLADFDCSQPAT